MGVAAEIGEYLLGAAERWLGKDDPLHPGQLVEPGREGGWIGRVGERVGKTQLTAGIDGAELLHEQVAKAAGQDPRGQEETGQARDSACMVRRNPAAGDDAVDVRMVMHRLSPGVQHGDRAEFGTEVVVATRNRNVADAQSRAVSDAD